MRRTSHMHQTARHAVGLRDHADVQVEPGGETEAKRNGSVALKSADPGVDREAVGMYRDAQVELEGVRTSRNAPIK